MKTEKKILVAFLLNLGFAAVELIGGILTGSVAILSDSIHDMGDAAGIGLSWLLEKKSKRPADGRYPFGYGRYSVFGGVLTSGILLVGSVAVIIAAIHRLINPQPIHYTGMIGLAVLGVCVNIGAAFFTRGGDSLNQKAVNLHMLEDCLGWLMVLVGAVVMHFAHITWLDPVMSIGVALFILIHAVHHLAEAADILLEKMPKDVDREWITTRLLRLEGVVSVEELGIWTVDGVHPRAIVRLTGAENARISVRKLLEEEKITCVAVEIIPEPPGRDPLSVE